MTAMAPKATSLPMYQTLECASRSPSALQEQIKDSGVVIKFLFLFGTELHDTLAFEGNKITDQ